MRKLISYSLFGPENYYRKGVIRNIKLAAEIFPGWDVVIFIEDIPENMPLVQQLKSYKNVEVHLKNQRFSGDGIHWRLLPLEWKNTICLSRDLDTSLTTRERDMTYEWLDSQFNFNVIRDEPGHKSPIMAGIFAGRGGNISIQSNWTKFYLKKGKRNPTQFYRNNNDLKFLAKFVYPLIRSDLLVFTRFVIFDGDGEVRIASKVNETTNTGIYRTIGMREYDDISDEDAGKELIENYNSIRIQESSKAGAYAYNKRYDDGKLVLMHPKYKYVSPIKNFIWWSLASVLNQGFFNRLKRLATKSLEALRAQN